MEECSVLDQLDPEMKNLHALKAVSHKLKEVSEALKGCQKVTDKLIQVVEAIAKSCAISQVESIAERLETQQNESGQ